MPVRVDMTPEVLERAAERSGVADEIANRFPLERWIDGERKRTLKQLESSRGPPAPGRNAVPAGTTRRPATSARLSHLPGADLSRPTADLLDTLYLCQQRQEWYRGFALANGEEPLDSIGSLERGADVLGAADRMRDMLDFSVEERGGYGTWTEAFRGLAEQAEAAGVLVMVSGVIASDTNRVLDPNEVRASPWSMTSRRTCS